MTIKEKLGNTAYEQLLAATLFNLGDTLPMQDVLFKLENDLPIHLATLGGSITEGLTQTHRVENTFCDLIYSFLMHELYDTPKDITFLNLGISCSYPLLGLCLTASHLLDFKPDLVIVEFALNESIDRWGFSRFESLIRNLLALPDRPALLILNLTNETNTSATTYMAHIGKHYKLPVINIGDGLIPIIQNHSLCWADYAADPLHPYENGHELIADCCKYYFKSIAALGTKKGGTWLPLPTYCFQAPYEHLIFLNIPKLLQISETNLTLTSLIHPLFQTALAPIALNDCDTYTLSFSLDCKRLIILFLQDNTPSFATATVCVDGIETCYLQSYSQFTSRYPYPACVINNLELLHHTITLKLTGEDALKQFYLLGIAYCI